jgi:hypothetical protein
MEFKIPNYPEDFFDFSNGVDISNEMINKWIKEMISELEGNPVATSNGISSGNTYVKVNRDNFGAYSVTVAKDYQEYIKY